MGLVTEYLGWPITPGPVVGDCRESHAGVHLLAARLDEEDGETAVEEFLSWDGIEPERLVGQ